MKQRVMIYFTNDQQKYPITYRLKHLIRRAVTETLAYEGYGQDCQVSVTFTDNEGIRQLNDQYRGIDKETDVLSLERTATQAEEFGHSFEREAAFLCVHSMLHLLGYDHENGGEQEKDMRKRQREILEQMGLSIQ